MEMHLRGFGKFQNKTIKLSSGINVIYGKNESGKSTLHSFIYGMFYGFVKPYTRRTIYTEDHRKYNPWSDASYGGALIFEKDGVIYTVQRDFTKEKEDTRVFIETTGEDVTEKIKEHQPSKVLQPGEYFFGVNSAVFKNTLFARQRVLKTDKDLAGEVRERLVNASSGGDENISVERALKILDERIKDIGTARSRTSVYGSLIDELEQLDIEIASIGKSSAKYRDNLVASMKLSDEVETLDREIEKIDRDIEILDIQESLKTYREVQRLRTNEKSLEAEIENLRRYGSVNPEDLELAIVLSEERRQLEQKIDHLDSQRQGIEDRISKLIQGDTKEYEDLDMIIVAGNRFQKLEISELKDFKMEDLESHISTCRRRKGFLTVFLSITLILYVFGMVSSTLTGNHLWIILLQMLLAPLFAGYLRIRSYALEIDQCRDILDAICESSQIMSRDKVQSQQSLGEIFEKARSLKYNLDGNQKLKAEFQEDLRVIDDKIRMAKLELSLLQKQIMDMMEINCVKDLNSFKTAVKWQGHLKDKESELRWTRDRIDAVIKDRDIEYLRVLDKKYSQTEALPSVNGTMQGLISEKEKLLEERSRQMYALKSLEGSLLELEAYVKTEVESMEKKEKLQGDIGELEIERKSLLLAKDRIRNLSGKIHTEYAPRISGVIGGYISDITGGRYDDVKIDKDLNIRVVESTSKNIVPVTDLSGGTMDQLYLGLRLGILNELISNKFPLILDESLAQYDDDRLRRVLRLLEEKSRERQIIIFTCHKREGKILEEEGIAHKKIILQQS